MAVQWGKTPLQKLKAFRARRWFRVEFENFAARVATNYAGRSEVTAGGAVSGGTAAAGTLLATTTALESVLAGQVQASLAAISASDLLVSGTTGCGKAIWGDGTSEDDTSLAVGSDETAYITLIVTNSDGSDALAAGGDDAGTAGGDNAAPMFVCVIAGDADHTDASDFLNASEIAAALAASDDHSAVTGWAMVAECTLEETAGGTTYTQTWVMNRNNVVQER